MADEPEVPETVESDRRLDVSLRLRSACVAFDKLVNRFEADGVFADDQEVVELRRWAGIACGLEDEVASKP